MPVDYTGLLIAIILWIAATWWSFLWIRATEYSRPGGTGPAWAPLVYTIAWTVCAAILLVPVGIFIIWFYDWLHHRA